MTSPQQTPPKPSADDDIALANALAAEHAAIYCYGLVSAHSSAEENSLVSDCLTEHRDCREQTIAALSKKGVAAPVAAAGYTVPFPVTTSADATKLAVQVENDCAACWRAVAERATGDDARTFAVQMLTESAIRAARWRSVGNIAPPSVAFPGGAESA